MLLTHILFHPPPEYKKEVMIRKNKGGVKSLVDLNYEAIWTGPGNIVAARLLAGSPTENCGMCELTYHLAGRFRNSE